MKTEQENPHFILTPMALAYLAGEGFDAGDYCNGCGREGTDCSRDPCADVIADREG